MKSKISITVALAVFLFVLDTFSARGQCYFAQTDKLNNVWVLDGPELICFDKNLKKIGSYANLMLGNPSTIDVSDPLKVALFYPQTKSLVLLNSKLAVIGNPISLSDQGIGDAILACRSGKRGFWIYDRSKGEIIHFDSNLDQSGQKIILDVSYSDQIPIYMQESSGVLYVAFKGKGISRFDAFGATLAQLPMSIDSHFLVSSNKIYYQANDKSFVYDIENHKNIPLDLTLNCLPILFNGKFYYFDTSRKAVDKL